MSPARVTTQVHLDAGTDIDVRSSLTGAVWIELGSTALFADIDTLHRLHDTVGDYLDRTDGLARRHLARTPASDFEEDRF